MRTLRAILYVQIITLFMWGAAAMKDQTPGPTADQAKKQVDLFHEEEEFFEALSFLPTDEHCTALKDFYNVVRKKRYDKTFNPAKVIASYLVKQPEYGWIETKKLLEAFQAMFKKFELTLEDQENDPGTFSADLGRNIGLLYGTSKRCSTVTHISALIFRTFEAKLVPKPRKFLESFLEQAEPTFRLSFYLLNFQNFFKCSDTLILDLQKAINESETEMKEEFLNLYEVFVDMNLQADKDAKSRLISNIFKSAGKTTLTYGAMFAIYYASTFIQMDANFRWAMDNAVLYEMNVMISELTRAKRQIKDKEYLTELQLVLQGNGNKLETKDNLAIGNRLIEQEHVASHCMECKLRAQMEAQNLKGMIQMII